MATIDSLTVMGYTVEPAMFEGDTKHPTVYAVEGHALSTYVKEDDAAAIQGLLDDPAQALAQETVEELILDAAALKIVGRSNMTKDELIAAIHAVNLGIAGP